MIVRDALLEYFRTTGLGDDPWDVQDCYRDSWIRLDVRGVKVPFFPIYGLRDSLILHDLHHMVTGYETTWRGELEVAAWELAAGGCGRRWFFWLDRALFLLLGCAFAPRASLRAFQRGLHCRNLYRLDSQAALAMDVDALRQHVGV